MKKLTLLILSFGLVAPVTARVAVQPDYAESDFGDDDGFMDNDMMAQLGGMDEGSLMDMLRGMCSKEEFAAVEELHSRGQAQAEVDEELAQKEAEINTLRSDKRELREAMAVLLKNDDGLSNGDLNAEKKDLEKRLAEIKKEKKQRKNERAEVEGRKKDLDDEAEEKEKELTKSLEKKVESFEEEGGDAYEDEDDDADDVAADNEDEEEFSMPPLPEEEEV